MMENSRLTKSSAIVLFFSIFAIFAHAISPENIPLSNVSNLLIQSALDSINDNSPTRHTYKSGNLISAQKLVEPHYVIYRLTLNLEPNCVDDSSCPRQACATDLRQHESGVIDVQINSIQCVYLHPQADQRADPQQQSIQDGLQEGANSLDQEATIESLESKVASNSSLQLDHEVQTFADGNERPFIAVRAIDRKYCAGCPYELNPTLPGLAAYGEQIVQSMDETGRSDFKHKVVSIVRVTRAVPPGSNVVLYELLLEIGETTCPRIGVNVRSDCSLSQEKPITLCLVTFEQRPWQQDSRKIVRNNCTDVPDSYKALTGDPEESLATSEATVGNERKEGTTSDVGGEKKFSASFASSVDELFENFETTSKIGTIDAGDTKESPVAEEVLGKTVIERKKDEPEVRRFEDKYREFDDFLERLDFHEPLKIREPEPVDRGEPVNEDLIQPEIVLRMDSHGNDDASGKIDAGSVKRVRRSVIDMPEDEQELVLKLAQKTVEELDEIDVDENKRVLLEVVDSKKRPGNDKVYYITMRIAKTNCKEGTTDCLNDIRDSTNKTCKAQIYISDRSSTETAKVLQSQCFDESRSRVSRSKRDLLGSPSSENPEDPKILEFAKKGLNEYSKISAKENEPFLVDILEATSQVVSGKKYRIKVRIGESTCPKGARENCQLREGSQTEDYLITVWSQPWKDNGNPSINVESLEGKNHNRERRSDKLVGAPEPNRLDDKTVLEYTKEGLSKYTETFNVDNEPYLIDILQSTSQVVSGMLHKITVRLGESTCPKGTKDNCELKSDGEIGNYEITVWSRPWLDHGKPDIKIQLSSDKKTVSRRSLRGQNYNRKMMELGKTMDAERAFDKFMIEHGKRYNSEEEKNYRFKVFQANMKRIESLRKAEQGTAEYGATIFADSTPEEFRAHRLGLRPDLSLENNIPLRTAKVPDIELPESFDWREKNVVTEVKDQGSCGSCWAFSVTGNIESLNAIKNGKLLSLSEQELVDCDKLDSGCEGGLPDNAYRAIEQLGGLELESDYPYDGKDEKCHFDEGKVRINIVEGVNITSNETQMAQWLVANGPMSIGINANAMQFYMGGVSHPFKFLCNADNLDHGVLIVGYGIHTYPLFNKKMPYWIIKNSWGPRWGEQGYYRVYRGDGTCGVNKMVTSAVVA